MKRSDSKISRESKSKSKTVKKKVVRKKQPSRDRHLIDTHYRNKIVFEVPFLKKKFSLYWKLILGSFVFWLLLVNYYEHVFPKRALQRCDWSRWEHWPKAGNGPANSHKVALFADPQIMDDFSYPGRPRIVNYFTRLLLDHYHARNWKYVHYYLNPETTIFLGDLFDGGRNWDDDLWMEEYNRFQRIFPKKPTTKTIMSLPGNHDIGFGDTVIQSSLERFSTYFGETSRSLDIGNHTFVLLDTISLSDTVNPNVSSIPREFLDAWGMVDHPYPRILLTHVPLYRNPKVQKCGPERESKDDFPISYGEQYQTAILPSLTDEILRRIEPVYVFSGDDHDYCHIKHNFYGENGLLREADEITVKSCAMNMGIRKPAIQLVSLLNDPTKTPTGPTIETELCYLPDSFRPLWMYAIALVLNLSVICVYIWNSRKSHKGVSSKDLPMPVSVDDGKPKRTLSKKTKSKRIVMDILFNMTALLQLVFTIFFVYYSLV